jgi:hypothetical protein
MKHKIMLRFNRPNTKVITFEVDKLVQGDFRSSNSTPCKTNKI